LGRDPSERFFPVGFEGRRGWSFAIVVSMAIAAAQSRRPGVGRAPDRADEADRQSRWTT
jgi:hypothetical protein